MADTPEDEQKSRHFKEVESAKRRAVALAAEAAATAAAKPALPEVTAEPPLPPVQTTVATSLQMTVDSDTTMAERPAGSIWGQGLVALRGSAAVSQGMF